MLLSRASEPKLRLEKQISSLRTALTAQKSAYFRLCTLLQTKARAARALEQGIELQKALYTEKITAFPAQSLRNEDKSATLQAVKATEKRLKQLLEGLDSAEMALRTNKQVAESKTQEVWRLFKIYRLLKAEMQGLCDPCRVLARLCPECQVRLRRVTHRSK